MRAMSTRSLTMMRTSEGAKAMTRSTLSSSSRELAFLSRNWIRRAPPAISDAASHTGSPKDASAIAYRRGRAFMPFQQRGRDCLADGREISCKSCRCENRHYGGSGDVREWWSSHLPGQTYPAHDPCALWLRPGQTHARRAWQLRNRNREE